ncbi:MAG: hypothetical protein JNM70_04440 [Anaerolineae bacterium]|nr:hypothetical protein [Anaerolineae bacterium]
MGSLNFAHRLHHYSRRWPGWIALGCILIVILNVWSVSSQPEPPTPEVITHDNIARLKPVVQIDFADFEAAAGRIDNGWFALHLTAAYLASINRDNALVIWDTNGQVAATYTVPGTDGLPATVIDAAFTSIGHALISAHIDGQAVYVAFQRLDGSLLGIKRAATADYPLRIWGDSTFWLEMESAETSLRYVTSFYQAVYWDSRAPIHLGYDTDDPRDLLSGPENDPDSFFRVGRILPPLAVTTTRTNLAKRWNLENGCVTASAQIDSIPGAAQITPDGRYFAWADGDYAALHWLDFETSETRLVRPLENQFIPFLLLALGGDVIIGVNVGREPVIVAWDTLSGKRIDLGEYRPCGRQPDLARLSADGTTLVIGCDQGLQLWQIRGM